MVSWNENGGKQSTKSWLIKTVVGPDHLVKFKVPDEIPEGPVEMFVVVQPMVGSKSIEDLKWTEEQAAEIRARLKSFDTDWNAPGMESYDTFKPYYRRA